MSVDRANPFADLNEFQPTPSPKPVQKAAITKIADETGFQSRQANPVRPATHATPPAPKRPRRRYTTGRNQQINIKATQDTIDRLYKIADDRNAPLGAVLELALLALEQQHNPDS